MEGDEGGGRECLLGGILGFVGGCVVGFGGVGC